jgi:hypothetical protein
VGCRALRHRPGACLGDVFTEERQDVFGLWVASEHRFGEDQFTVEVNVEDAARPGDDLDSVDQLRPLLEDARDQTGCVGQRASGNAVLDPDTMPHSHRRHRSFHQVTAPGPPNNAGSITRDCPATSLLSRRSSREPSSGAG